MLNKKENSLKTVRTLLGLKGTEVAQCLNISVQNIRTWEYGKRPSIDSLEKLSILYSNVYKKGPNILMMAMKIIQSYQIYVTR